MEIGPVKMTVGEVRVGEIGRGEVGAFEMSPFKAGLVHLGSDQDGAEERRFISYGSKQIRVRQPGLSHIGTGNVAVFHAGFGQIRARKVCLRQGALVQISLPQDSPFQVRPLEIGSVERGLAKIRLAEISPMKVWVISFLQPLTMGLNDSAQRLGRNRFLLVWTYTWSSLRLTRSSLLRLHGCR
jgi:hypothetical protein